MFELDGEMKAPQAPPEVEEEIVIPENLEKMTKKQLMELAVKAGAGKLTAELEAREQEILDLRTQAEELSAEVEAKGLHVEKLEKKLADANTLAMARRDAKLVNFPNVDFKMTHYRLKWSKKTVDGGHELANGNINAVVPASKDGVGYNIEVLWKDGYTITNDLRLADALVNLGKGISCEEFTVQKGE